MNEPDTTRRDESRLSLGRFMTSYFPHLGDDPEYREDRCCIVQSIQCGVLSGNSSEVFANRAIGKTTIIMCSMMWCFLYRHHRHAMMLAAKHDFAKSAHRAVRTELSINPRIRQDFPEVEHLKITNSGACLALTMEPSPFENPCVITFRSILSGVHGSGYRFIGGEQVRPDVVMCDDLYGESYFLSASTRYRIDRDVRCLSFIAGHNRRATVINVRTWLNQP